MPDGGNVHKPYLTKSTSTLFCVCVYWHLWYEV